MASAEQARARRYDCSHGLIIQLGMSRVRARLKNLSGSGGYVESDSSLEVGEEILLLIRLDTEQNRMFFNVTGEVVWTHHGESSFQSGVRWLKASTEESIDALRFFVTEFLRGTTGRIRVDRDREDTSRKAYIFDFAAPGEIEAYLRNQPVQVDVPEEGQTHPEESHLPVKELEQNEEAHLQPQPDPRDESATSTKRSEEPMAKPNPERSGNGKVPIALGFSAHPSDEKPSSAVSSSPAPETTGAKAPIALGLSGSESQVESEERVPFAMGGAPTKEGSPTSAQTRVEDSKERSFTHYGEVPTPMPSDTRQAAEPKVEETTLAERGTARSSRSKRVEEGLEHAKLSARSPADLEACRRGYQRFKLTNIEMSLVHRGVESTLQVIDISRSGAAVSTVDVIPAIQEGVTIKIRSRSSRRPTRFNARIVRADTRRGNRQRFAIQFDRASHRGHQLEQNRILDEILSWA